MGRVADVAWLWWHGRSRRGLVAFFGVSRTVSVQREANRKQQWWERARWALDLTLAEDTTTRAIGLEVLDALSRSEYAGEHEFEVVEAAIAPTLDAYGLHLGSLSDEERGQDSPGEAHLTTEVGPREGGN